jgi:subtilisin family serine protease
LSSDFSCVVAVGGIASDDEPYGADGTQITVRAPATDIRSTKPVDVVSTDEYDRQDGTSLACPFVAGLAALVWNKFPHLTAVQVRDRLRDTAQRINGMRVIDVEKALTP